VRVSVGEWVTLFTYAYLGGLKLDYSIQRDLIVLQRMLLQFLVSLGVEKGRAQGGYQAWSWQGLIHHVPVI
jgi:hypothetical protein